MAARFVTALTPTDAARLILEHIRPLPPVRRPLADALDLVLAEEVTSPIDLPPWPNSAMDGYAVRAADIASVPVTLDVVETIAAGRFPQRTVGPGQAARIFTGAPTPEGVDTVVRQEDTGTGSPDHITILDARDARKNVRQRGEDIRRGAVALSAGTPLGPAALGVLASIAHDQPLVYPPPRAAFMSSGDEIVDLGAREEILAGKKVASSNAYTLGAAIRRAGATPWNLGIAADTTASLETHLGPGRDADLLLTSAGVSVGEHDLMRDVLTSLGCEIKLWKVRLRPGGPLAFGMLGSTPWIGLPGNPVSTLVTFELFVRPVLRRLAGHTLLFRRAIPVVTDEAITLGPRLQHFLRAVITAEPVSGPPHVRLTGPQGSGILTSMARAEVLLIVPEDQSQVPAGAALTGIVLDDPHHVAEPPF